MGFRTLFLLLLAALASAQEERVCFYTEPNYGGTELCAKEGGNIDVYATHLNLNDDFESVKVPIGLQVIAYADDGFHGYSMKYQSDISNLGGFSNLISSLSVRPAQVCFYSGMQFAGTEYCASVHDMIDLKTNGNHDNNFESIKVAPGLLVKVFVDKGFEGRFTWFTKDNGNLSDFNNVITSFIVEYENEVCFYTNANYKGNSLCAKPGEAHNIYATTLSLNDDFSSVLVPHDLFVIAYFDDGFHGYSRVFTENIPSLTDFNDRISSIVVGFSGVACFYTETFWRGSKFCATYGVEIDVARSFPSFNDRFQSIIIPDDLQAKTFRHADYLGPMMNYQSTAKTFGTFANAISSFNVTVATTSLYDNFADTDVIALQKTNPSNLTVCAYVNDQGAWKLLYRDDCHVTTKNFACNNIYTPNLWRVSTRSGHSSEGTSVCKSEFGNEYTYGTPSNTHSNSLLSALTPTSGIWINVFYDAFSNSYSHRQRRSTECGGPNQRACTYDDSLFQSWLCSLPKLFGCRDPYCQDGLTREKIFGADIYVCRCPSNHRVRRGLEEATFGACGASNLAPEALTGEEIVNRLLTRNSMTRTQLEAAWTQSSVGRNLFQEMGGWIYANPSNPRELQIVRAPRTASEPFRGTNDPEQPNPAIDLNGAATANARRGWILVANFHTHPLQQNQQPSNADLENAIVRGVPGIVISRGSVYVYGPERRAHFLLRGGNPRAYPNDGNASDHNPNARRSVRRVRENPFPFRDLHEL